jgi:hypothetical protein
VAAASEHSSGWARRRDPDERAALRPRTPERRWLEPHTGRHPRPPWGGVRDRAVEPARRIGERFTCRPRPRITASSAPAIGTPRTARPHVRRHARRHRTRAATGPGPRSTTQGACFTTSPGAATTSVAREVKLYLALHSPSASRRAFFGPVPSPSSVPRRTRSESAAATPGTRRPCPHSDCLAGSLTVVGRGRRQRCAEGAEHRPWVSSRTTPGLAGDSLLAHCRVSSWKARCADHGVANAVSDVLVTTAR